MDARLANIMKDPVIEEYPSGLRDLPSKKEREADGAFNYIANGFDRRLHGVSDGVYL